jgi:hypothetical protein
MSFPGRCIDILRLVRPPFNRTHSTFQVRIASFVASHRVAFSRASRRPARGLAQRCAARKARMQFGRDGDMLNGGPGTWWSRITPSSKESTPDETLCTDPMAVAIGHSHSILTPKLRFFQSDDVRLSRWNDTRFSRRRCPGSAGDCH